MDTVIAVKLLNTIGKPVDETNIRKLYDILKTNPDEKNLQIVLTKTSAASIDELENKGLQIIAETALATASSQPSAEAQQEVKKEDEVKKEEEEEDDEDIDLFGGFD